MRHPPKKFKRYFSYFLVLLVGAFFLFREIDRCDNEKIVFNQDVAALSTDVGPVCHVVKIIDGDTLRVRCRERPEKVRLLFVNTPEYGKKGSRRAKRALQRLVDGGEVQLHFENGSHEKRDRYGRLLAYVVVDDLNVNIELVREGWTRYWTRYGHGSLGEAFRRAEKQARKENRGLWTPEGWNKSAN